MSMSECPLCNVVDAVCERLPTEEARRKCKEISQRVMKGEIDGATARRELLKHIDEETFDRIVHEALILTES
jgi:hypothetical protein